MEQYIKKSALVAEIRKRLLPVVRDKHYGEWEEGQDSERIAILNIINTIEVKEVEDTESLKVRGYLVRDKDDYTAIYAEKPHRGKTEWVDGDDSCLMTINDARLMPDIEFEDEPVEVEITLKRYMEENKSCQD